MIHLESLIQSQKSPFLNATWTPNMPRTGNISWLEDRLSDLTIKASPYYEEFLTLWSTFNTTVPNQVEGIYVD